jgi:hypothetical protein
LETDVVIKSNAIFCDSILFFRDNILFTSQPLLKQVPEMPPKKAAQNKKQLEKAKQKIIEDKTFGLKNKKGAKAQKYIKSVQQSVQNRGVCC